MDGQKFLSEFLEAGRATVAQDEDGFVTLTDKNGNTYVANTNESEKERYKETGKKLSQVKKEESEKKAEETKPETKKEDTEKESKDKFADYLTEKGLRIWEHPRTGEKRIYLNKVAQELLNIEMDRYNTGNIRVFMMDGEKMSNSYGYNVLSALDKVYYDVAKKKIVLSTKNRASEDVAERLEEAMNNINK